MKDKNVIDICDREGIIDFKKLDLFEKIETTLTRTPDKSGKW